MSNKTTSGKIPTAGPAGASVRDVIARSRPEDYDGHTEFARLTPRERLAWLDAAVVLWESRGGAVEEPRPNPGPR
jgi:hypothetical protein